MFGQTIVRHMWATGEVFSQTRQWALARNLFTEPAQPAASYDEAALA